MMHFAVMAGIYVYFENYGRYDWMNFFVGLGMQRASRDIVTTAEI